VPVIMNDDLKPSGTSPTVARPKKCQSKSKSLKYAPLAQLDRASGYEPEGREFESLRARHFTSVFF
jgi:hypothetical protein